MKHFEKEILGYLRSHKTDLSDFILTSWGKSRYKSFNYYFQEVFLIKTGIISINTYTVINGNGYLPYVVYSENNLYHEKHGTKELSISELSKKQSEIKIANHIIEKLAFLDVDKIRGTL